MAKNQIGMIALSMSLAIRMARETLEYEGEGPVTAFVLMSRAITLSEDGPYTAEAIANALFEVLSERGFLTSRGLDSLTGTGDARNTADGF